VNFSLFYFLLHAPFQTNTQYAIPQEQPIEVLSLQAIKNLLHTFFIAPRNT
jgi:hypothetical protein